MDTKAIKLVTSKNKDSNKSQSKSNKVILPVSKSTSSKKAISSSSKKVVCSVKKVIAPIKKGICPIKNMTVPVKKAISPAKKDIIPLKGKQNKAVNIPVPTADVKDVKKEDKQVKDLSKQQLVKVVTKGGAAVDSFVPNSSAYRVLVDVDKVYSATLNQSNLDDNNNKFYIIQVLVN